MAKEIKKPSGRGGKRVGAGRKKLGVIKISRTLDLLPETSEAINALAKDKKSYGAVVDKAVKKMIEDN